MRVRQIAAALACGLTLGATALQARAGTVALDYHTMRYEVRANGTSLQTDALAVQGDGPTTVDIALAFSGGLDIFGIGELKINPDPYARWAIELTNPLDTPLRMQFTVAIPTIRLRSDEWQAANSLTALLNDLDGDGARLTPTVPTSTGLPGAPTVMQLMDSGLSLRIPSSTLVFFGGAPADPLGDEGLTAEPGDSATRSWSSTASQLPDHSWIGPDVAWNTLNLQVGFEISPHDRLVLRAGVDINPVGASDPGTRLPEPGTIGLLLAGLLLAAPQRVCAAKGARGLRPRSQPEQRPDSRPCRWTGFPSPP